MALELSLLLTATGALWTARAMVFLFLALLLVGLLRARAYWHW